MSVFSYALYLPKQFGMEISSRMLSKAVEGKFIEGSMLGEVMVQIWRFCINNLHMILFCNAVLTNLEPSGVFYFILKFVSGLKMNLGKSESHMWMMW